MGAWTRGWRKAASSPLSSGNQQQGQLVSREPGSVVWSSVRLGMLESWRGQEQELSNKAVAWKELVREKGYKGLQTAELPTPVRVQKAPPQPEWWIQSQQVGIFAADFCLVTLPLLYPLTSHEEGDYLLSDWILEIGTFWGTFYFIGATVTSLPSVSDEIWGFWMYWGC